MGVKLCHCAKFLAIGQTVAEISRFLIFFKWPLPPSLIFNILNFNGLCKDAPT